MTYNTIMYQKVCLIWNKKESLQISLDLTYGFIISILLSISSLVWTRCFQVSIRFRHQDWLWNCHNYAVFSFRSDCGIPFWSRLSFLGFHYPVIFEHFLHVSNILTNIYAAKYTAKYTAMEKEFHWKHRGLSAALIYHFAYFRAADDAEFAITVYVCSL